MNFSDFLNSSKSSRPKPKSTLEELSSLIRPLTESFSSSNSLSAENSIQLLQQKLVKNPSYEQRNPEEILPVLKKQLSSQSTTYNFIKELGLFQHSQKLEQSANSRYSKRTKESVIKIKPTAIEFLFKSKPNSIEMSYLKLTRQRKRELVENVFTFADETIESLLQDFSDAGVLFKSLSRRFSIQKPSSATAAISEKERLRTYTIIGTSELNPIHSDSSSSSSIEEVPIYYKYRNTLYHKKKPQKFQDLPISPITNQDYKFSASNPLNLITPQEISSGEVVKCGFLMKRIRDTNKFHRRWVVLRGFKIFWYRKAKIISAKHSVTLGKSLVYHSETGKEKCLSLALKERVFHFVNDETGAEWKFVINNQICFKGYLEEFTEYNVDLLEFYQDLSLNQVRLDGVEIKDNMFYYFINALPAHSKLQILSLANCKLTDNNVISMCDAIKATCSIQELDLSQNFLTAKSVFSISALLKQEEAKYNTILHLNLSDNTLDDEAIESLFRAFYIRFEQLFFPKLLHQLPFYSLYLNRVEMGDLGLNAITNILNKVNILMLGEDIEAKISLGIAGNWFSDRCFIKFVESISQYHGIKKLDVSDNENIGDEEIIFLAEALCSNYWLMELDIRGVSVTRNGYNKIFPLLIQNYALSQVRIQMDDEFKIAVIENGNVLNGEFELEIVD